MRPSKNQALINALATEIKRRRRELGFSQEDLAGHCQLDRPYISLIEVGRKQPTLSVLMRLADGLQYSLADFMGQVEKRYALEQSTVSAG
jgi:transcriptional regulator with XRE-family HTH domain